MNINEMLDAIRTVIGKTDRNLSEADVMATLVSESEGWRMRLQELEAEDKG